MWTELKKHHLHRVGAQFWEIAGVRPILSDRQQTGWRFRLPGFGPVRQSLSKQFSTCSEKYNECFVIVVKNQFFRWIPFCKALKIFYFLYIYLRGYVGDRIYKAIVLGIASIFAFDKISVYFAFRLRYLINKKYIFFILIRLILTRENEELKLISTYWNRLISLDLTSFLVIEKYVFTFWNTQVEFLYLAFLC